MKRFCFILTFCLLCCGLGAQTYNLTIHDVSREFFAKKNLSYNLRWIGNNDSAVYIVQQASNKSKKLTLYHYNLGLNEVASKELPTEDGTVCMGGFLNPTTVDIMMLEKTKNSFRTLHMQYNPVTLEQIGETKVMKSFNLNDDMDCRYHISSSPNGQVSAGIYVITARNRDPEVQVELYSRDLETYWNMDCGIAVLDQASVTDSGEVLLSGYYTKKMDKKTYFEVVMMDGEKIKRYCFNVDLGTICSSQLVKYDGHRIILSGVVQDPDKKDENKVQASSIFALVYNTDLERIESTKYHSFSFVESARMQNLKDSYFSRYKPIEFVNFFASTNDPEGAIVGYRPTFYNAINGIPSTYTFGGILLLRINNSGDFVWSQTLRHWSEMNFFLRDYDHADMRQFGNKTFILIPENASNIDRPESKPFKKYTPPNGKNALRIVAIDPSGDIQNQYIELPKNLSPLSHPHRDYSCTDIHNPRFVYLLSGSSKTCLATFSIKQ